MKHNGELRIDMEKDEHGNMLQIDVKEGFNKITDVLNEFKDAVIKIKDADIDMKDWSFTVNHSDGEYIVDFKMQMSVKAKKK